MASLILYILLFTLLGVLIVAYESSARFAKFVDDKVLNRQGQWAITDEENFESKCIALVTRQLTPTHYELKVYEEYKLRTVIVESHKFELIRNR